MSHTDESCLDDSSKQPTISSVTYNMKEQLYTYFRLLAGGSMISFCIRILLRSAGVPMKPPIIPPTAAIPIFSQKDIFSPGLVMNSLAVCKQE
jgi:hypothetical protein